MSIVYAYADHDRSVRHVSRDMIETLCGQSAGQIEPLALPVTCIECRTANGRLTRERMAAEAAAFGESAGPGHRRQGHVERWQHIHRYRH